VCTADIANEHNRKYLDNFISKGKQVAVNVFHFLILSSRRLTCTAKIN